MLVFIVFMLSSNFRMVPLQALASRVPRPEQRARFMSAQSAVQHAASALGAILSSAVLLTAADGTLIHMDRVAWGAMLVAGIIPFTVALLERRVKSREAAAARP